jgi:hypothetical protein
MKKSELRRIVREELNNAHSDWWSELSPEEKREYIKKHPNTSKDAASTKSMGDDEKYSSSMKLHKMFSDGVIKERSNKK